MEIKNIGIPASVNHKPAESQQLNAPSPAAAAGQNITAANQKPEGIIISSISGQQLEWLRVILSNFGEAPLFKNIEELLSLFATMRNATQNSNILNLLDAVEQSLLSLKESLVAKDFSPSLIKGIIQLYINSEDLKLKLLDLLPSLPKEASESVIIRERIVNFVNFIESINFFNKEGISDNSVQTLFLYFPFTFPSASGKDKKAELIIYPEKDNKGRIKSDIFSCSLILETEYLGKVKVFLQVNQGRVSCSMNVESPSVFQLFERSAPELSERLKKIQFVLGSFNCNSAPPEEFLPSLLPRLEVKA